MPKVNPFGPDDFLEGKIVRKKSFTDFKRRIEAVESIVDQDNIRQEGLDRRNFSSSAWHEPFNLTDHRLYVDETPAELPNTDGEWDKVPRDSTITGPFSDGDSTPETYAMIGIPWTPEVDSHLIVRASGVISTRQKFFVHLDNYFVDIGLRIRSVEEDGRTVSRWDRNVVEDGYVWPYQRISLNAAYSSLAEQGFRRSASDWRGYKLDRAGKMEDPDPAEESRKDEGHATEWMYDRKTYMYYNFHLLYHLSSDYNAGQAHRLQTIPTGGDLRCDLMYRTSHSTKQLSDSVDSSFQRSDHITGKTTKEKSSFSPILRSCMVSFQKIKR